VSHLRRGWTRAQLARLTGDDVALVRHAGGVVRLALALRALHGAQRALRTGSTGDALRAVHPPGPAFGSGCDPDRWGRAVERSAVVLRAGCLARATALARLLEGCGHPSALVLGARLDAAGDWVAHAWVEVDGKAVQEDPTAFTRLAEARADDGWRLTGLP
jgi:hypothetical protein